MNEETLNSIVRDLEVLVQPSSTTRQDQITEVLTDEDFEEFLS